MRRNRKNDKKQTIVWKKRFAQLEALGFEWGVPVLQSLPNEDVWQERLNELLEYKEANGDCRVPAEYEKNKKLGKWVKLMRRYYKEQNKKQNPVWKERFAQLEALGFEWEGCNWQQRFEELCEYKQANGDCRVPLSYETNRKLANWVANMRKHHKNNDKKKNTVWKKRFAQLEEIEFEW
eukprot:CAMPEP_0113620114 /NCGR_PEP_ID=MMETSP0017_2-20120614/10236_1 /TAXON_ID=2856 /ORGANISM="Cylindrotheca closterium" /LENGTH=178 /DNA_ID=CAMNT_0000529745 /DNA_START=634 /DNA_END=1167 /DNA_ORIENTATION=+ /assembly_acc=CAM_ASM_000147